MRKLPAIYAESPLLAVRLDLGTMEILRPDRNEHETSVVAREGMNV